MKSKRQTRGNDSDSNKQQQNTLQKKIKYINWGQYPNALPMSGKHPYLSNCTFSVCNWDCRPHGRADLPLDLIHTPVSVHMFSGNISPHIRLRSDRLWLRGRRQETMDCFSALLLLSPTCFSSFTCWCDLYYQLSSWGTLTCLCVLQRKLRLCFSTSGLELQHLTHAV